MRNVVPQGRSKCWISTCLFPVSSPGLIFLYLLDFLEVQDKRVIYFGLECSLTIFRFLGLSVMISANYGWKGKKGKRENKGDKSFTFRAAFLKWMVCSRFRKILKFLIPHRWPEGTRRGYWGTHYNAPFVWGYESLYKIFWIIVESVTISPKESEDFLSPSWNTVYIYI